LRSLLLLATSCLGLTLSGCATPPPPAPPAPTGLTELMAQPGERALFDGLRAYDDGQYSLAETALKLALSNGLKNGRDQATAHKLLAFIFCTSERVAECETAFRHARKADPQFALSRSESGHPLWGPVYQRSLQP
jgi:Tfp pilus assembly protein PilF